MVLLCYSVVQIKRDITSLCIFQWYKNNHACTVTD